MKQFFRLLGVGLFLFSSLVESKIEQYNGLCNNNLIQTPSSKCISNELSKLDKEVNQTYLYYSVNDIGEQLKTAEELWLKFIAADCAFHGPVIDPLIGADVCKINKLKARINVLNEVLSDGACVEKISFYETAERNKRSECLRSKLHVEDQELNRVYKSKVNNQLKIAERLWIRFRDADCVYAATKANVHDYQRYQDRYNSCLIARTKERINELTLNS